MIGTTKKSEALHVSSIPMANKPHGDIKIKFQSCTDIDNKRSLSVGSAKSIMALSYKR